MEGEASATKRLTITIFVFIAISTSAAIQIMPLIQEQLHAATASRLRATSPRCSATRSYNSRVNLKIHQSKSQGSHSKRAYLNARGERA